MPAWPLVLFYAVLLVALLTTLATASYPRKERVRGDLVPTAGVISVTAPRDGIVSRVFVSNGADVREDQLLAWLSIGTDRAGGQQIGSLLAGAAERRQAAALGEREAVQIELRSAMEDIDVRAGTLDEQVRLLDESHSFARERVDLAEQRLRSSRSLAEKGFVSSLQLQQWQDTLLANRLALAELDQRRAQLTRERRQLSLERVNLEAREVGADARSAANLADMLAARAMAAGESEMLLKAAKAGRVTAVRAREGVSVRLGETIAVILPKDSVLQAQLWVPSRSIGFIRAGQPVTIRLDAFPHQMFGSIKGRVREVSMAPTKVQDLVPGTVSEPSYQVLVDLETQALTYQQRSWRLLPGMQVEAVIVLNKRSVLMWLLDPLRGLGT